MSLTEAQSQGFQVGEPDPLGHALAWFLAGNNAEHWVNRQWSAIAIGRVTQDLDAAPCRQSTDGFQWDRNGHTFVLWFR